MQNHQILDQHFGQLFFSIDTTKFRQMIPLKWDSIREIE
jgi:hypothetical protein